VSDVYRWTDCEFPCFCIFFSLSLYTFSIESAYGSERFALAKHFHRIMLPKGNKKREKKILLEFSCVIEREVATNWFMKENVRERGKILLKKFVSLARLRKFDRVGRWWWCWCMSVILYYSFHLLYRYIVFFFHLTTCMWIESDVNEKLTTRVRVWVI
jgi:hypothetical protein